eukprot:794328-Prorocentrum_minimum.AAC.1
MPAFAEALQDLQVVWVPMANPDGYEFSRTSERMWRKNRRGGMENRVGPCAGVDLNRNFPNHWAGADTSANICSEVFR